VALRHPVTTLEHIRRQRLAELVSAASYGSVLVIAALTALSLSDVASGHGAEIVAGVGLATWIAHLFAELLGGHVFDHDPLRRDAVRRAMVDGSPILASTVLPAVVLLLARVDIIDERAARVAAIVVAIVQLVGIGAFVTRVSPAPSPRRWTFALATAGIGVGVVVLTVLLGH
jgi:hypothetical protein